MLVTRYSPSQADSHRQRRKPMVSVLLLTWPRILLCAVFQSIVVLLGAQLSFQKPVGTYARFRWQYIGILLSSATMALALATLLHDLALPSAKDVQIVGLMFSCPLAAGVLVSGRIKKLKGGGIAFGT